MREFSPGEQDRGRQFRPVADIILDKNLQGEEWLNSLEERISGVVNQFGDPNISKWGEQISTSPLWNPRQQQKHPNIVKVIATGLIAVGLETPSIRGENLSIPEIAVELRERDLLSDEPSEVGKPVEVIKAIIEEGQLYARSSAIFTRQFPLEGVIRSIEGISEEPEYKTREENPENNLISDVELYLDSLRNRDPNS